MSKTPHGFAVQEGYTWRVLEPDGHCVNYTDEPMTMQMATPELTVVEIADTGVVTVTTGEDQAIYVDTNDKELQ